MKLIITFLALMSFQVLGAQDQMFDICPLKVGEDIPEATLTNEANEPIELTDLASQKPTVLVFYRGAWCGYCTQHLAELNDIKSDVDSLGFQIVGITVDQSEKLEESKTRSEAEIEVYSDAKLAAIKAFGLDWHVGEELYDKYLNDYKLDLELWSGEDHHSLPVPAIYIIKDGKIEFQYVNPNYNTRLKPATLLAVLKTL